MPKSFTEKERLAIIKDLRRAAMELMLQKGIKKTTVDELVERVHIPKGTFYLFYKSKELLLFDAIEQKEEEIQATMIEMFTQKKENLNEESFTDLILDFYKMAFDMGILPIMLNGEMEVLIRKLPDEVVERSFSTDEKFLKMFLGLFPELPQEDIQNYAGAFRAIFIAAAYKREIGGEFERVLRMLIRGIVHQLWEAKK